VSTVSSMSSTMDFGAIAWLRHHKSTIPWDRRIIARRSGVFSNRDRVGCEARSAPLSGKRPHAILKAGISARGIEIVAIRIPARDGEDAFTQNIGDGMADLGRIAVIRDN
jgi:hypothetical protein